MFYTSSLDQKAAPIPIYGAARKFFGRSYFVTALIRELFFEKYQNSMSVTKILRRDDVNIICKLKLCCEKLR